MRSENTACRCLGILKPTLNDVDEESWEELDPAKIGLGAHSLCWLVWPKIDKDSLEILSTECPRIIVNPKPSRLSYRGKEVPTEALLSTVLDNRVIKDIDPKIWVSTIAKTSSVVDSAELSIAEKFRLAFVERDARLAPKRAKNARRHQRRTQREWVASSAKAKAVALAAKAIKTKQTWI